MAAPSRRGQHEEEREHGASERDALLPSAVGHDEVLDEPAQTVAAVQAENTHAATEVLPYTTSAPR